MLRLLAVLGLLALAGPVAAQEPPRVRISGEATATVSTTDAEREGWFNYSDYETSTVRSLRLSLVGEFTISPRIAVLGELRSLQVEWPEAYALYVRVRPWLAHDLDIHLGRVPPTFGAFPRRVYLADNPLIGMPLAYQYLTSTRADAVPGSAAELVSMRGRGWETQYSVGRTDPEPGLPVANALRWDTGVQVRWQRGPVTTLGSVTQGTLGDPRLSADNGGAQVAGRVTWTPHPTLTIGASIADGPYLSEDLRPALPEGRRLTAYRQQVHGLDVELSRDRWLVRTEWVHNRWGQPDVRFDEDRRLVVDGWATEARYTVTPGVYVAARVDGLDFSPVSTPTGPIDWDADVSRVEVGAGWRAHRRVLLKGAWQRNRRDGGRVRASDLGLFQVVTWF